jgi:threonine dehydratase
MIKYSEIIKANSKIKKYKVPTLLQSSKTFSRMSSNNIYLKPENLQVTGSYKIGGAINVIMNLTEDQKKRGVITTSAGNWAQAVAYASQIFNVKSVIVMKEGTSETKIIATKGYGGKVVIYGKDTKDTIEKSMSLAKSENLTYLNCFEDENLIAGHGCIGLDIIEEKPDTDVIFCPIGGGAFISGVAIAAKHSKPEVKIIGVEPEGANAMYLSLKKDKLVGIEKANTIADGLAVERPGARPFEITRKYVDEVIVVTDEEIKIAMILLLERAKLLVEPAGAASLAAIISKRLNFKDKEIVAILSGGNIDLDKLTYILEEKIRVKN